MFISGVTCALAYGRACRCEGWSGVISRSLRRGWDIYAAFLLLTLACAIMVYLAGRDRLADESNTRILLEHPGATLAHAAILQYRPSTPTSCRFSCSSRFVRAAAVAAAASAERDAWRLAGALCARARLRLDRPRLAQQHWFFNPLAWQLLIVLGRVVGHRGEESPAVGDVAHGACTCRSLSGFQPGHRIELAHQAAGSTDPADSDEAAFPVGQIESQSIATAAFSGSLRFWRYGSCLAIGEG